MGVALLLVAALSSAFRGNTHSNYTRYATQLLDDLLSDYRKQVPPISERLHNGYSSAGTDVKMQLRLFKLRSISASEGRMQVKVWWRMWWQDLRLSWNPEDYGGITTIRFNAASFSMPEDSDICTQQRPCHRPHRAWCEFELFKR